MVFSHQKGLALALAERFEYCHIVTADAKRPVSTPKSEIRSTNWVSGSRIFSAMRFYKVVIPILISERRNLVVFSHMTDVQSMLIAPLTRILGIRHFLWYAHAKRSAYLRICWKFITGIITSTSGSCPVKGPRVFCIGQAVDHKLFSESNHKAKNPPLTWFSIGRLDPSKRLEVILETFLQLRERGWSLTLDIFGAPSSTNYEQYFNQIRNMCLSPQYSSWVKLHGPIRNNQIVDRVQHYDGFVHAFNGSLDKTLIEAMMLRRVVVSTNYEFQRLFKVGDVARIVERDLIKLVLEALNATEESQIASINHRYANAVKNHSSESWLDKVEAILKS